MHKLHLRSSDKRDTIIGTQYATESYAHQSYDKWHRVIETQVVEAVDLIPTKRQT